ncbi:MAG: hypothetical protein ACRDTQ_16330 [Micromonosporaceae bacterium]
MLNPYGGDLCPPGFGEHHLFPKDQEPVRINLEHGLWIRELLDMFDVTWATSWNGDANRLLAPLLRIPVLPVISMPPAPFQPSAKVPLIEAFSQQMPAVWIDDLHTAAARAWRDNRRAPTALITVDPAIGLTRECIDQALAWAETL